MFQVLRMHIFDYLSVSKRRHEDDKKDEDDDNGDQNCLAPPPPPAVLTESASKSIVKNVKPESFTSICFLNFQVLKSQAR